MAQRYFRIRTDYADPAQPLHIRDERGLAELMADLHGAGYLVSESVLVRQSFIGFKPDSDAPAHVTHYFSASPLGEIALFLAHVVEIAEVVVQPGSLPYPD